MYEINLCWERFFSEKFFYDFQKWTIKKLSKISFMGKELPEKSAPGDLLHNGNNCYFQ